MSKALCKSSNSSAPGPDHIPFSVWKSVHRIKPSLLPSLLDPLLAHRFHPPSLKKALGIVLDKLGKPSYDSPSSFRVIVLLRMLSKILERVVASRLSGQAAICSLIHPLQCGSLAGRSTTDAALVLQHNVEFFHRIRYKVSTLFLHVKGSFDNVESPSLLSLLRRKEVSPYLVQWVGSFLRDRTCHLTFKGSPRLFAPVSVGSLKDPPSPHFCSSYTSPPSTWTFPGHLLSPTSTTLLLQWPCPPTESTFASFRSHSQRSKERPPESTCPSPSP